MPHREVVHFDLDIEDLKLLVDALDERLMGMDIKDEYFGQTSVMCEGFLFALLQLQNDLEKDKLIEKRVREMGEE